MLEDSVGYLRISEFTMVTSTAVLRMPTRIFWQQGMEKLVVDLRNNPGGVLSAVCDVLRQILPEGLIVYTEDKYGNPARNTSCDGEYTDSHSSGRSGK